MFRINTPLGVVKVIMMPCNGIVSIEKTGQSGFTDTYTITFTNGTTFEYEVTNGDGTPSDADDVAYILGVDAS